MIPTTSIKSDEDTNELLLSSKQFNCSEKSDILVIIYEFLLMRKIAIDGPMPMNPQTGLAIKAILWI